MNVNKNGTEFQAYSGDESPQYKNTTHRNFWNMESWGREFYPNILDASKTCHTFVDVGAWIGPFTLYAANHFQKVISFEPDDMAFQELKANVELNGYTNVELTQAAVSTYIGMLTLGTDRNRKEGSHAGFSFSHTTFDVPCVTLKKLYEDRKLSTGTYLKIDIEGAEYNLFDDIEFFVTNKPLIFLELHRMFLKPHQQEQLLRGVKNLSVYYNGIGDRLIGDVDYWFLSPKQT